MADLASPELYPIALDAAGDQVRFITLAEADYRAASFLDERLLPRSETLLDWALVENRAGAFAGECDFIFHIGHVGSTLLSRLLGDSATVFSVREPAILRRFALPKAPPRARLGPFLKLWARTFRSDQRTLLKATSFVGEISASLMRLGPSGRSILMFVAPQIHIAGLLAGEASRADLAAMAPDRLARLRRRLGEEAGRGARLGPGEQAAMSWLCEIMALSETAAAWPDRILWMDFEAFLGDPALGLADALTHLRQVADPALVARLLRGPHMARYSKAQEHAFGAAHRRQVLHQAFEEHRDEIGRGLAWLDAAATAYPRAATALRAPALATRR